MDVRLLNLCIDVPILVGRKKDREYVGVPHILRSVERDFTNEYLLRARKSVL